MDNLSFGKFLHLVDLLPTLFVNLKLPPQIENAKHNIEFKVRFCHLSGPGITTAYPFNTIPIPIPSPNPLIITFTFTWALRAARFKDILYASNGVTWQPPPCTPVRSNLFAFEWEKLAIAKVKFCRRVTTFWPWSMTILPLLPTTLNTAFAFWVILFAPVWLSQRKFSNPFPLFFSPPIDWRRTQFEYLMPWKRQINWFI